MTKRGGTLVIVALVIGVIAAPVAAKSVDPRFEAYVPDPVVEPGQESVITVQLLNDAEDVDDTAKTAEQVRVTMRSGGSPISIESGTRLIGDLADGSPQEIEFRITVPRDADPGTYRLPIDLQYEFEDESETSTIRVPIEVESVARFAVVSTETSASIGDTGTLTLTMENVGGETAFDATVLVESTDAALTFGAGSPTSEGFIGRWAPGETRQVSFKLGFAETAIRRNYSIGTTVQFEDDAGQSRSDAVSAGVQPRPRQSFEVVEVTSAAPIGGSGQLELAIRNTGPDTVYDSTVTVASDDADIAFAEGAPQSQSYTGEWQPGEVKRLSYRLRVSDQAVQRDYSVSATINYEDEAGNDRRPRTVLTAITPLPEQTFEVRDVAGSLSVGSTGSVDATLVNTGDSPVRDVVVVLQVEGADLSPRAVEYPVGDLAAGESAPVSFTVDVPDGAVPGARRLGFLVRYENDAGDTLRSDPLGVRVEVNERQPPFIVTPVNATFAVDTTGTLTLDLTNDLDEPITDVTASLIATEPLESEDATAFTGSLSPGETVRLSFKLEVTDDAIPKSHPIQLDVSYRDEAGTLKESGPYRIGITVNQPPGSGLPLIPIAVVVIALGLGGVWWYRRR